MHVRLLRAKDDNRERFVYYPHPVAEVVELVDTTDSKRRRQPHKSLKNSLIIRIKHDLIDDLH